MVFGILRSFEFFLVLSGVLGTLTDPADIVIVIFSQAGPSAVQAESLRESVISQAEDLRKNAPEFLLTHERPREEMKGAWTIYPIIPILLTEYENAKWHFFCLESTVINLERLMVVLSGFNSSTDLWLGHALYDSDLTIIHHFADPSTKFPYPNIASGFAVTKTLAETLDGRLHAERLDTDFAIDASYEFSDFVWNRGVGPQLTDVTEFCVDFHEKCATYPKKFSLCGNPVNRENILFAVKTFDKNHKERMPILLKTWLRHTVHYALFSNKQDEELENIIVVPNTDKGHCAKTYALLQQAKIIMRRDKIQWLVVSDDDTILSVSRLSHLLSCHDAQKPLAIGERYGFSPREETGYDFLTSGSALAISAPLLPRILGSPACRCPSPTTPDDMFLFGICFARLGIEPLHYPQFHQARPNDYAKDYLTSHEPVSFHKFWMVDPIEVYQDWFRDEDRASSAIHSEL